MKEHTSTNDMHGARMTANERSAQYVSEANSPNETHETDVLEKAWRSEIKNRMNWIVCMIAGYTNIDEECMNEDSKDKEQKGVNAVCMEAENACLIVNESLEANGWKDPEISNTKATTTSLPPPHYEEG